MRFSRSRCAPPRRQHSPNLARVVALPARVEGSALRAATERQRRQANGGAAREWLASRTPRSHPERRNREQASCIARAHIDRYLGRWRPLGCGAGRPHEPPAHGTHPWSTSTWSAPWLFCSCPFCAPQPHRGSTATPQSPHQPHLGGPIRQAGKQVTDLQCVFTARLSSRVQFLRLRRQLFPPSRRYRHVGRRLVYIGRDPRSIVREGGR